MNHCKDCKWWRKEEWYHSGTGILKTCEHPKVKKGYGWNVDDVPRDGALIENDEGWAWLTGPEFGCVNFEVKESKND